MTTRINNKNKMFKKVMFSISMYHVRNNEVAEYIKELVEELKVGNSIQSIYIFNRFGKIIAITAPNSHGWDGYYNGKLMSSSTYWYSIELFSGEFIKGPFSLIRR